jgi:hypothetical protein
MTRAWTIEEIRELLGAIEAQVHRDLAALSSQRTGVTDAEALNVALQFALRQRHQMLDRRSFALLRTMFLLSNEEQPTRLSRRDGLSPLNAGAGRTEQGRTAAFTQTGGGSVA